MAAIKKADPIARRNLIILILLLALAVFFLKELITYLNHWVVSDPEAIKTRANVFVLLLFAASIPLWIGAAYLWRIAKQVITSGEFPPPTMSVIVDTTIQTGQAAVRRARRLQIASILIIAMGVIGPLGVFIILRKLLS